MSNQDFKICKAKGCGEEFNSVFSKHRDFCSSECYKASVKSNLKLKSLNRVSIKKKEEDAQYKLLRQEFLSRPENKICPITGWETTDIHHKKGRIGKLYLDTTYWVALSREGHQHVEQNPQWAKENGYSLNRLSND